MSTSTRPMQLVVTCRYCGSIEHRYADEESAFDLAEQVEHLGWTDLSRLHLWLEPAHALATAAAVGTCPHCHEVIHRYHYQID